MTERVDIQDIQAAIERCMAAHPPAGKDLVLHPDASLLADILGEMIYRKLDSIPRSVMSGGHLEAFARWEKTAAPELGGWPR